MSKTEKNILGMTSILLFGFFLYLSTFAGATGNESIFDKEIYKTTIEWRSPVFTQIFLFFTTLGNWYTVVFFGIAVGFILWEYARKKEAVFLWSSILLSQVAYALFKLFFQRVRPDNTLFLIEQTGFSFPSGHATTAALLYGAIGFIVWHTVKKKIFKTSILFLTIVCIVGIGFSRVYLGVHFPSDVLAGWALGGSLLILLILMFHLDNKE